MKLFKPINFFLLIVTFYYLTLIHKSSFIVGNVRHFSLFDDMMISMRYAKNFAEGNGLLWNKNAEAVEGFTNLLWTLYMTLIHLLHIPPHMTSLIVQLTGVVLMILALITVAKIAAIITKDSRLAVWGSLLFTAFYFPLVNWSVILGTEVSLLTFFVVFTVFLLIKYEKPPFPIYIILILGILTRADFVIFAGTVFLFLLLFKRKYFASILLGFAIIIISILATVFFRYGYYGDILPNTYYLKATGYPVLLRIARGIVVSSSIINVFLLFFSFAGALIIRNRIVFLLLFSFIIQIFYSIYVGGDAWEQYGGSNRYVAIVFPLFIILFFYSLFHIQKYFVRKVVKLKTYKIVLSIFLLLTFISFNSGSYTNIQQLFLIRDPLIKSDNKLSIEAAYALNEITSKSATVAVTWAGTTPYFLDRKTIDLLGKNDAYIARQSSHTPPQNARILDKVNWFWPGHTKWDYEYSINKLQPDVVFGGLYPPDNEGLYLNKYYERVSYNNSYFHVRKDSKNIFWKKIDLNTKE